MREEQPTPDNTLRAPADARYQPYTSEYAEVYKRKRTINQIEEAHKAAKRKRRRKQERQNKKGR